MVGEAIYDFFERRSDRARAWSIVAQQKGGEYRPPRGGLFNRTKPELYAEIHNIVVQVTLRVESSGEHSETFTIIRAPWLLGAGPELKVLKAGLFRKMGRALGLQDVPTGDAVFDQEFVVKSQTPVVVPHVLSSRPRRSLRALGNPRVDCSAAEVQLTFSGVLIETARLSLAMDATAQVAAYGMQHVQTLNQMPGRFIPPQGSWGSRIAPYTDLEMGASRVRALAVSYAHGIYFALRTELHRDVPDLALRFLNGVPEPTPPDGLFDPQTFNTIVSLGNLTLRTRRGMAMLELPGNLNAEDLTRAARWLSGFAKGRTQGAFR